jgi:uncharacterized Zn-finger protein
MERNKTWICPYCYTLVRTNKDTKQVFCPNCGVRCKDDNQEI